MAANSYYPGNTFCVLVADSALWTMLPLLCRASTTASPLPAFLGTLVRNMDTDPFVVSNVDIRQLKLHDADFQTVTRNAFCAFLDKVRICE